jgi:tRNA-2-methylthio-N6-dimethylallyladenosine synthase
MLLNSMKSLIFSDKMCGLMKKRYFIRTFGCAQNEADSERIASYLEDQGYKPAETIEKADYIVINTCMIRQMAENRVYGLVNNLKKLKSENGLIKIVVTGCMVGMAVRDKTGKLQKVLKERLPIVDEFLPIEEIGFDFLPKRSKKRLALVPISNGCNNFCTFCVVPFSRGREISRPYEDILKECQSLVSEGYSEIMLLGMNVNSYGADLLVGENNIQVLRDLNVKYFKDTSNNASALSSKTGRVDIKKVKPVYVTHLGRQRIPTLFPLLLDDIAKIKGLNNILFMSSNPWDFSDELIEVIATNKNISREVHLPVQSGNNDVLKRMNRWYTKEEYLKLVATLKFKIKNLKLSTDIIVGFCGETDADFADTVDLAQKVGFSKAYVAIYSDRPMTAAHKAMKDDVPFTVKKKRWKILEDLINLPNLKKK